MGIQLQAVSYDGVVFPFCQVTYAGQAEYDETTRVLQGYTIKFRCACVVSSSQAGINGSAGGAGAVADFQTNLHAVLRVLAHPRKRFLWTSGGATVFDISAATSGAAVHGTANVYSDRRWGPKPRVINIQQHTGGRAARVTFEIECFIFPCSGSVSDIESFWWQYRYSFDRNFRCTRTISGKYRLRSPLAAGAEFLPDGDFWPALFSSFYRESINHSISTDGSIIEFTITDKQAWRTLPRPLTDGTATMRVEQTGATIRKSFSCHFEAPIDTDKKVILQFITAMVQARFADAFVPAGSAGFTGEFITSLGFTNHEFENKIDCSVTSVRAAANIISANNSAGDAASFFASLFGDVSDITPGGGDAWLASDGLSELRGMLGTGGLLPSGAPVFDLCGGSTGSLREDTFGSGGASGGESSRGTGPSDGAFTLGSGGEQEFYSAAHEEFPYTAFTESWQFYLDNHLVVLPVTSAAIVSGASIPDVVQQTANPSLRVIQIGHARRLGSPPDVPQPPFVDHSGDRVTKRQIRPSSARVLPGGQLEYSLDWMCEVIVPADRNIVGTGEGTDNNTVVRIPINPQLSETYFTSGDVGRIVEPVEQSPDTDGTFVPSEDYFA